jgi:hypothetical protein
MQKRRYSVTTYDHQAKQTKTCAHDLFHRSTDYQIQRQSPELRKSTAHHTQKSISSKNPPTITIAREPQPSSNPPPPSTSIPATNLRLRYMNTLTNHQTPMHHKHTHNRMHLEDSSSAPNAKRHIGVRPAVARPPGHGASQHERSGDGCTFKVLRFPGCVFGYHGDGYVEARETGEAAEDEEGEEEVVERGAHAEGEGGCGGRDAEGYLLHFD